MNYELCTMLTFFRIKSFPVFVFPQQCLSFSPVLHIITTVCLYVLSAVSVYVFSLFKSYQHHLLIRLCHGIVLYSASESFRSPHTSRGLALCTCVIPSIYVVYPKSPIGPLAVDNGCFGGRGNEKYILWSLAAL